MIRRPRRRVTFVEISAPFYHEPLGREICTYTLVLECGHRETHGWHPPKNKHAACYMCLQMRVAKNGFATPTTHTESD